jgi:hypothetical protein
MSREPRRLSAVVSADVAGYSRLIGRDEVGTTRRLDPPHMQGDQRVDRLLPQRLREHRR